MNYSNVSGPNGKLFPELTFDGEAIPTVSAPAYELALFHAVARLRVETGVNWKDAFHYLYATWSDVQVILTANERDFEKVDRSHRFPIVHTPSSYEAQLKSRSPKVHDLVFGEGD